MSAPYRSKTNGLTYEAYRIGNIGWSTPEWVEWAIKFGLLRFDEDAEGKTVAWMTMVGRGKMLVEKAKAGDYLIQDGGSIYVYDPATFPKLFTPIEPVVTAPENMKTVTLNEEGNDHVESLQAEARQADEAPSGQDSLKEAFDGIAAYRRQRALELAVDVYRTGMSIPHEDITKVARSFDLFLDGKMIYREADHEA